MPLSVDITVDVAVDAELHEGSPQTFGIPPEIEGDTAGAFFFGEAGDADSDILFVNIPGPPGRDGIFNGDSLDLPLGPSYDTTDGSEWTGGAVLLDPTDSVGYALIQLNQKLALAASADDVQAIMDQIAGLVFQGVELPLGEDVGTDDASLWDGGAIALSPTMTVSYAVSRLNHKIADILQTLADGVGAQHGFELPLGDIAAHGDGSWSPGAVSLSDSLPVSEAVDRMNEVLAKLLPSSPPDFPNGSLTIANPAGSSPLLASGVFDNSGTTPWSASQPVTRITAAGPTSNTFNDVGPGDSGTIAVLLNGAAVVGGSRALTGVGDNGAYAGLVLADQKDFPTATPGFWKSLDVSLNLVAAPVGVNKVRITHTGAGQTGETYFVRDLMTATPVISGGSVAEVAAGTLAYSSGVPHYDQGASLTVGLSIANLSGETYYGGADPLVISGVNGIIAADTHTYFDLNIPTPIARQTTAATVVGAQVVAIDGANVHNVGQIQATAKNVNGSSGAQTIQAKNILVKRGSAAGRIDEQAITVSGLGSAPNTNSAVRKSMGAGDTPIGAGTAWNSAASPISAHEAAVVGGVLKHDQTDYTSYLPAGPNYSTGRSGTQYVTFSFARAARSAFKINVTGAYSDCRIKLPGVSDVQPNAPNGWWNAFQPYDGAGVPGEAGDAAAGCASGTVMSGGSGSFTITFGTESSTNAVGNEILVRFKLAPGQSITALSFSN